MADSRQPHLHLAHNYFPLVEALHAAFIQIGEESNLNLSLDEALEFLGLFVFAEFQTAYALYEKGGYAYPCGRLFHILGNLIHSLGHVPTYMDPYGDEWQMRREDVNYPMYDGGPSLAAMHTLMPWTQGDIESEEKETP